MTETSIAGTNYPTQESPADVDGLGAQLGTGDIAAPAVSSAAASFDAEPVARVAPAPVPAPVRADPSDRLDLLSNVEMDITAELGRTRMTVRELLSLAPGTVVELDRAAGSPVDLFVNGTLIARGEVVVVDEEFGVRVSEIVSGDSSNDSAHS